MGSAPTLAERLSKSPELLDAVDADRDGKVTSYRVGEHRLALAGALVEALIRTARSDP